MRVVAPALLLAALLSLVLAPWPLTLILTLVTAPFIPLAPLALGLINDALYLSPGALPIATMLGAVATLIAFFVHTRLASGIIA